MSRPRRYQRHLGGNWPPLVLCGTLAVTGCSMPKATAETEAPHETHVGVVTLRGLALVISKDGLGRVAGTLVNDSTAPVEVMVSDDDDALTVVVPAHGAYPFDTHEAVFDTVETQSGDTCTIAVTTPAVSTELEVPVVDVTLAPRVSYLAS